jgi:hypothetical protein
VIPIRDFWQANHESRKPVFSDIRVIPVDDERLPGASGPKRERVCNQQLGLWTGA